MNRDENSTFTKLYEELLEPELSYFPDLSQLLDQVQQDTSKSSAEKLSSGKAVIEKGRTRFRRIQELKEFQSEFILQMEKLSSYVDLQPRKKELEGLVKDLSIDPRSFYKKTGMMIDEVIDATVKKMEKLQSEKQAIFQSVAKDVEQLESTIFEILHTMKRRLFEVFTKVTPYPDLHEELERLRNRTIESLQEKLKALFLGKITVDQFRHDAFDIAYDQDVMQLRKELSFRATRLREMRLEAIRLLRLLDERLHLLKVSHGTSKEVEACRKEVSDFLKFIENPFNVFEKTTQTFEGFNIVIRNLWIQLEELQKKCAFTLASVDVATPLIERELLIALDDLEEVIKITEGMRPNLVVAMQNKLQGAQNHLTTIREEILAIEKRFPFIQPFSFFLTIQESKKRRELLLRAKKLKQQIDETKKFAKTLQYVKVFESDRADGILEALEREGRIENFDSYEALLIKSLQLIEEEMIFDIGLLDLRALLDIDETKLKHALKLAIQKIENKEMDEDIHHLLSHLRHLCHHLFLKRIEKAASRGNRIALHEDLIFKLYQLVLHSADLRKEAILLEFVEERFEPMREAIAHLLNTIEEKKLILEELELMKRSENAPLYYAPGFLAYF